MLGIADVIPGLLALILFAISVAGGRTDSRISVPKIRVAVNHLGIQSRRGQKPFGILTL